MKFKIAFLLGSAVALCNVTAHAQDKASQNAETVADLRCVAAISESAVPMEKLSPGSSTIALMYYLGRLDGRDPDLDIENGLAALTSTMTAKDVSEEDIRCGAALSKRGKEIKDIGMRLMQRATHAPMPAPTQPDRSL